jgi:hypothetical protein
MEGKAVAVVNYQTRDGLAEYGFSVEFQPDKGWRVYIVFQPYRQDEEAGSQLPHQSVDSDGRHYVDWPSRIDNLGDARMVAELWAERIQYLKLSEGRRNMKTA